MYLTTRYIPQDKQLDLDSIINELYGLPIEPIKETINTFYSDFSYPRFKTYKINLKRNKTRNKVERQLNLDYTLETNLKRVADIAQTTMRLQDWNEYKVFNIPKASGGFRTIKAPNELLKRNMQDILFLLKKCNINASDSAYAYVEGRDCKHALQRHQTNNSNWFLKLDISKFFDKCNPVWVERMLGSTYPFTERYRAVAHDLVKLCTLDDALPQGSPLSPFITNLIMTPIDYEINKCLAGMQGTYIYTRYADDMLISSRTQIPVEDIIVMIKSVFKKFDTPFSLNETKTRYGSKAGSNWNLGIMYNKDNNLTVGHKRKRMLKAMVHRFATTDTFTLEECYALQGELAYLKAIEPEYYTLFINFINKKYDRDIYNALLYNIKHY